MVLEAVFLGMNQAGEEVYDWLNQREDVEVRVLLTEKEQLSVIEEIEPDIVVSSGFEHKVPENIIEVPEKGIVNLHPSYLPYNRGSHPHIWSLVEGTPAGVSIHYMVESIDEGPVIDRKEVRVESQDTARTLYDRLTREMVELFKQNWPDIVEGSVEAEEQELDKGNTHYQRELEELCELKMGEEVKIGDFLERLKALTYPPYKTAYFERYGKKYYVEIDITPEEEYGN
jgi:methionyl-tRNA formyltransferase